MNTISNAGHIAFQFSDQLRAVFEPDLGAMWLRWNPKPRPCFNPQPLAAGNEYCQFLRSRNGAIEHDSKAYPVESSILRSDVPGMFDIIALWVDAALRIDPHDLRVMGHLVVCQNGIA